jgi:hypothetical protein
MESGPRRRRVELTDQWEQIELLCGWTEQEDAPVSRDLPPAEAPKSTSGRMSSKSLARTLCRRAARSSGEFCQACCVVGACLCQVVQDRIQTSVLSHEL